MIEKALQAAGYDCPPTLENLIECYVDYAISYGQHHDDAIDDINCGLVTTEIMCNRLIRCN